MKVVGLMVSKTHRKEDWKDINFSKKSKSGKEWVGSGKGQQESTVC